MKYVQVKDEIQVMANGKPWKEKPNGEVMPPTSFSDYLENIVLPDPAMGTGYKALKACALIEKQFASVAPGEWVAVEDAHWEMMKRTIENPKGSGIHPGVLRQFIPFMDAVIDARVEQPSE